MELSDRVITFFLKLLHERLYMYLMTWTLYLPCDFSALSLACASNKKPVPPKQSQYPHASRPPRAYSTRLVHENRENLDTRDLHYF